MQNEQRFNEIIDEILALAYEANLQGNDPYPGLGYWKALAHNLTQAVMTTAGDRVTEEIMQAAAWKAVERMTEGDVTAGIYKAIERMADGDDEPIEVREMVDPS